MTSPATHSDVSLRYLLFPTDFLPCSETALKYGVGLARRYGATLYTLTVVPEQITDYAQPPDPFYLRHAAERKIASFAKLEFLEGIRHREFVKEGLVAETVSELVGRLEVDLVVLGTHGREGMKKLVLGSVAEEIISSVPRPVMTVGPRVLPLSSPQPRLQRILYVTNLLSGSTNALTFAASLAEQEHAHLTLLHVLKIPGNSHSGNRQSEDGAAKERLAQLLPPEAADALDLEFIVAAGIPAEQILKVAERQDADLIVMGRRQTPFARAAAHLPRVTPYEVICHARCPVLTVGDTAGRRFR